MMTTELPWVSVESVCAAYGFGFLTAKNKIRAGTFPVPTYKVGNRHVIDKAVHEKFFELRRQSGLSALAKSTNN